MKFFPTDTFNQSTHGKCIDVNRSLLVGVITTLIDCKPDQSTVNTTDAVPHTEHAQSNSEENQSQQIKQLKLEL